MFLWRCWGLNQDTGRECPLQVILQYGLLPPWTACNKLHTPIVSCFMLENGALGHLTCSLLRVSWCTLQTGENLTTSHTCTCPGSTASLWWIFQGYWVALWCRIMFLWSCWGLNQDTRRDATVPLQLVLWPDLFRLIVIHWTCLLVFTCVTLLTCTTAWSLC